MLWRVSGTGDCAWRGALQGPIQRIFLGKNDPNSPDSKAKKPKSPDFCDKFQWVAKNIEGFWFFSTFTSSMYSQIWLNHFMCDHHFSYITSETITTIIIPCTTPCILPCKGTKKRQKRPIGKDPLNRVFSKKQMDAR